MVHQAVTLDARSRADVVLKAITPLSDDTKVVVRRREGLQVYWYTFTVSQAKTALRHAAPDMVLREALNLHESGSEPAVQVSDATWPAAGVLLDGDAVLGVLEASGTSGSRGDIRAPVVPPPSVPGIPASPGLEVNIQPSVPQASFEAYPAINAPSQVAPAVAFTLEVGLRRELQAGARAEGLQIANAPASFTLGVQVFAPGFAFVDGHQRDMVVQRDQPESALVTFSLVALELAANEPAVDREITVQVSYQGQPLARAWHDVRVVRAGVVVPPVAVRGAVATPLHTVVGPPIDLIAYIEPGEGPGDLLWRLESPHAFPAPNANDLESQIAGDNGQLFAAELVRNLAQHDGQATIVSSMRGVGREVAAVMPVGFFRALSAVWQAVRVQNASAVPSVLLVSSSLYVPWELAWLEENVTVEVGLLDAARPASLGAQCRVGRWLPPERKTFAGRVPALPPAPSRSVAGMVVVVGNYSPQSGLNELKEALEEGRALVAKYAPKTVGLRATRADVDRVLDNQVERDLKPVSLEVLHFACHGSFDPGHPAHNGLILEDGVTRLDPLLISGSALGNQQPFVFLNACQSALPQQDLSDAGGFARAFVMLGCRGFLAPLWNVNDVLAKEIALRFYQQALEQGVAVGEVLRDVRQAFAVGAGVPPSTPMAYVFYGHPDLVLQ